MFTHSLHYMEKKLASFKKQKQNKKQKKNLICTHHIGTIDDFLKIKWRAWDTNDLLQYCSTDSSHCL